MLFLLFSVFFLFFLFCFFFCVSSSLCNFCDFLSLSCFLLKLFTKLYIKQLRLWKISRLQWWTEYWHHFWHFLILFHRPQTLAPIKAVVRKFSPKALRNGHDCCVPNVDWPISIHAAFPQDARLRLKQNQNKPEIIINQKNFSHKKSAFTYFY